MANAGVSVGSEEPEPGDGWPYDTILNDLTGTPTMDEYALATVIVDRYMASYPTPNGLTQSAMANSALPNLVAAVDNLAQALMTEINAGHVADVQQARNAAAEIYYPYYIDLYHFAQKIKTDVPGAAAQAQAVMYEVSISIYFPKVESDYLASYDNTAFASDTQWNEFLKRYYNVPEPGPPIAYLKKGPYGAEDHDLYIYTAPTAIGGHGTLIASDYWAPDGDTVAITAIGMDKVAYLKKGQYGAEDHDLYIYTAPTAIGGHGTLIASDYWAPDGDTVAITAIGMDKVAYLKKGAYGAEDYNLYIYTAPTDIGGHGTLIASDYWAPDGDTVAITAIGMDKVAYLKKGAYCSAQKSVVFCADKQRGKCKSQNKSAIRRFSLPRR
jgi:hypothetical protein